MKGTLGGTVRRSLGVWTAGGGIEVAEGAYSSMDSAALVGLSWGSRGVVLRTTVKLKADSPPISLRDKVYESGPILQNPISPARHEMVIESSSLVVGLPSARLNANAVK